MPAVETAGFIKNKRAHKWNPNHLNATHYYLAQLICCIVPAEAKTLWTITKPI